MVSLLGSEYEQAGDLHNAYVLMKNHVVGGRRTGDTEMDIVNPLDSPFFLLSGVVRG